MADAFRPFEDLLEAVRNHSFDRPPAFVANAHVTGLSVARALADDVPVIALDRADNADGASAARASAAVCGGRDRKSVV